MTNISTNLFEKKTICQFTEEAYLNYAMYVILDRALPHLGDGLKPVQRRIIYAMSELGLSATSQFKKSARTVGDVLGKFHPHGDSACYEAMVLMAQSFSIRYPLIIGQGNWGSIDDPKSFAAMRYTEAKLTTYTGQLLKELSFNNIEWQPNFDNSLKEPKLLPAILPNILLNGASGIAVGMSTDIPPHNLTEVVNACCLLLDKPESTIRDLLEIIKGPDYPTGAKVITAFDNLLNIYQTGHGTIKSQATYSFEKDKIVIDSLPHLTYSSKILEQISDQLQSKNTPALVNFRDESDHEHPVRLVLLTKRTTLQSQEELIAHLLATTDLEKTFKVNMNVIGIDNKPEVKGLKLLLSQWLDWRKQTIIKRLECELMQNQQMHQTLEGLMIVYQNIERVIEIIRFDDHAADQLAREFDLTEFQVNTILNLRLAKLSKLEESKIQAEQKKVIKKIAEIQQLLSSPIKLKKLMKKELQEQAAQHGDLRRSVVEHQNSHHNPKQAVVSDIYKTTIILSEKGWLRCAKEHLPAEKIAQLSYKTGDGYLCSSTGESGDICMVLDSYGRVYNLNISEISGMKGYGTPVTGYLNPPQETTFNYLKLIKPNSYILVANNLGFAFKVASENLLVKNKKGKEFITLKEGSFIIECEVLTLETKWIVVATSEGRLLIFKEDELPVMKKGKGSRIITLNTATAEKGIGEQVIAIQSFNKNNSILINSTNKKPLKLTWKDMQYYRSFKGSRGRKLPRGFQKIKQLSIIKEQE